MQRVTEGKRYIYDSQQATNDRLKVYRCASSPVVNGIPGEAEQAQDEKTRES